MTHVEIERPGRNFSKHILKTYCVQGLEKRKIEMDFFFFRSENKCYAFILAKKLELYANTKFQKVMDTFHLIQIDKIFSCVFLLKILH